MTTPHHVRPPHHELPRGHRLDGIGHDATHTPRPRLSTAPAGLFAPAPEVVREKVVIVRKTYKPVPKRKVAACGTVSGRDRHQRLKEPVCEPCRLAFNEVKRRYAKEARARARNGVQVVYDSPPCGTRQAYQRHERLKEPTCVPCKAAHAAYQREKYAERAALLGREVKAEGPRKRRAA